MATIFARSLSVRIGVLGLRAPHRRVYGVGDRAHTMAHHQVTAKLSAVESIVRSQRTRWLRLVQRKAGAKVDPEDVVQSAFTRALERAEQLQATDRAEAWLGRIVHTVLHDELRRQAARALPVQDFTELAPTEPSECRCAAVQAEQLKPEYAYLLKRMFTESASISLRCIGVGAERQQCNRAATPRASRAQGSPPRSLRNGKPARLPRLYLRGTGMLRRVSSSRQLLALHVVEALCGELTFAPVARPVQTF